MAPDARTSTRAPTGERRGMGAALVSRLPPPALPTSKLVEERRRLPKGCVARGTTRCATTELAHERLRLRHAGHLVDVSAELVLGLHSCVVRISLWRASTTAAAAAPARGGEANVLVIPHGLFGEAAEHLMLLPCEFLYPAVHVLKHLALYLGVAVVKVRVETG